MRTLCCGKVLSEGGVCVFLHVFLIVVFASCGVSACDLVDRDDLLIQKGDGFLCKVPGGAQALGEFYARGSMWLRRLDGEIFLFYLPEERRMFDTPVKVQCYKYAVCAGDKILPAEIKDFLALVVCSWSASMRFLHCAWYAALNTDVTCSMVDGFKKAISEELYGTDTGLQVGLGSWARCVPICRKEPLDKVICYGADGQGPFYGAGAVWLSSEPKGFVLCCKPVAGPECVVYRYGLECKENMWPKNWGKLLSTIKSFAASSCRLWQDFQPESVHYARCITMAVLSGRINGFGQNMWFSWRPVSGDDDVFVRQKLSDDLVRGSCVDGVYGHDSAWVSFNGDKGCLRYRSQDDTAFQFMDDAPRKPEFCKRLSPDCFVDDFILNAEAMFIANPTCSEARKD